MQRSTSNDQGESSSLSPSLSAAAQNSRSAKGRNDEENQMTAGTGVVQEVDNSDAIRKHFVRLGMSSRSAYRLEKAFNRRAAAKHGHDIENARKNNFKNGVRVRPQWPARDDVKKRSEIWKIGSDQDEIELRVQNGIRLAQQFGTTWGRSTREIQDRPRNKHKTSVGTEQTIRSIRSNRKATKDEDMRNKEAQRQVKQARLNENPTDQMKTDKIRPGPTKVDIDKADDAEINGGNEDLSTDRFSVSDSWIHPNSHTNYQADRGDTNDRRGADTGALAQENGKQRLARDTRPAITKRLSREKVGQPGMKFSVVEKAVDLPQETGKRLEKALLKWTEEGNEHSGSGWTKGLMHRKEKKRKLTSDAKELNDKTAIRSTILRMARPSITQDLETIPRIRNYGTQNQAIAADDVKTLGRKKGSSIARTRAERHVTAIKFTDSVRGKLVLSPVPLLGDATLEATNRNEPMVNTEGEAKRNCRETLQFKADDAKERVQRNSRLTGNTFRDQEGLTTDAKDTVNAQEGETQQKSYKTKNDKVGGQGSLIGISSSFNTFPSTPASRHRSFPREIRHRQRREEPKNTNQSIVQESPTTKANSSNITCDDSRSCRGRCMKERDPGPTNRTLQCFCDRDCDMFQDCCADYDDYCPTHNVTSPTVPDVRCVHEGGLGIPTREIAGIWMISSCPKEWLDEDVRSKCLKTPKPSWKNYTNSVPVTTKNGTTYKNRFCAQCNGVKKQEWTYYDKERVERKNYTTFKWKPWEGAHRRYCLKLESACSLSNVSLDLRYHCQNGTFRLVYIEGHNVKNQFCLKCSRTPFYQDSYCGPIRSVDRTPIVGQTPPPPFFAELFAKMPAPVKSYISVVNCCPAGEVFDHNLDTCRRGIISAPTTANVNKLTVAMWVKPFSALRNRSVFAKQDTLDTLKQVFGISNIHIQRKSDHSIVFFELDFIGEGHILRDIGLAPGNINRLINFTKSDSIKITGDDYHMYKVTSRLHACVDIQEFGTNDYTVIPRSPPAVFINKSQETFYSYQYFANNTKKQDDRVIPIGDIHICRLHLTANCSGVYIPLQEHEYVVFPNGSLYRNVSRETFSDGHYDLRNKTAWICTNWSASYNKKREITIHSSNIDYSMLRILSCIALSLSIFSLVLFVLTYSLFSELRTLPGINLMNLSVSLLLLHSLWFATGETHVPLMCSIIAASIHYLALVSFTWMSIIAFGTWRIFSTLRPPCTGPEHGVKKTKILSSMTVGWIPALIFVIICVVLDKTETFTVGYGGGESCFINNNEAKKFLFVVPTAVSVAVNAIFFIKTVVIVRRTKKQAQAVTGHSQNRKSFWVYVRLASLMGFTWIFGFLSLLLSEYLLYPFVIFNTLQGVYIAAAFVFKTRVKQLYIKLLCSRRNKRTNKTPVVNSANAATVIGDTKL